MKKHIRKSGQTGAFALVLATATMGAAAAGTTSWLDQTISPVSNPILFEDPKINSEVHPIYMDHILPDSFEYINGKTVPLGGQVQVFAVQLRYAINDRLAVIATKDGYIEIQPQHSGIVPHSYGFADRRGGIEICGWWTTRSEQLHGDARLSRSRCRSGSTAVYQGRGAGVWKSVRLGGKGFWIRFTSYRQRRRFNIPDTTLRQADRRSCTTACSWIVSPGPVVHPVRRGERLHDPFRCAGSTADQSLNAKECRSTRKLYDLINSGSGERGGQRRS
jgi:hypothetical protein